MVEMAFDPKMARSLSRTSPKGCLKHHGHKGDPKMTLGVTPGPCGANGLSDGLRRWKTPPTHGHYKS